MLTLYRKNRRHGPFPSFTMACILTACAPGRIRPKVTKTAWPVTGRRG